MLGSLGAAFGAVVDFWLGSNKGLDRTKELLAQAAPIGPSYIEAIGDLLSQLRLMWRVRCPTVMIPPPRVITA